MKELLGFNLFDLLGRKVLMQNGKPMQLLSKEFEFTVRDARYFEELNDVVDPFVGGSDELKKVTHHLLAYAMNNNIDKYLADATVYMEMFGLVCLGWQWLKQGVSVVDACRKNVENLENPFHLGKLHTMRYFFTYEYPRVYSLSEVLRNDLELTISMDKSWLE